VFVLTQGPEKNKMSKYFGLMLTSENAEDWDAIDIELKKRGVIFEVNYHPHGKAWRFKESELIKLPWDDKTINDKISPEEALKIYGNSKETPYVPTNNDAGFTIWEWLGEDPFNFIDDSKKTGWIYTDYKLE